MMKETGYFEDLMSWVGKGGTLLMFDFMCVCIFYFINTHHLPTDQRLLHVLGKVGHLISCFIQFLLMSWPLGN